MAGVTKEHNFKPYVILINVNLSSHVWLVGATLDTTVLRYQYYYLIPWFKTFKYLFHISLGMKSTFLNISFVDWPMSISVTSSLIPLHFTQTIISHLLVSGTPNLLPISGPLYLLFSLLATLKFLPGSPWSHSNLLQ